MIWATQHKTYNLASIFNGNDMTLVVVLQWRWQSIMECTVHFLFYLTSDDGVERRA